MDTSRVIAYVVALALSFGWIQWKRTSSRTTRAVGVVVILGAFIGSSLYR